MGYTLNGTNILTLGFKPGRAPNSNMAIGGFLDFPKRLEKSFHSWPDEDGVQPWLNADLMFYDGRQIDLYLVGHFANRAAALTAIDALKDLLDVNTLMELAAHNWAFDVIPSGGIEVNMRSERVYDVKATFFEPEPNLGGDIPTEPDGSNFLGIDRIHWDTLGIIPLKLTGRYGSAQWKEMNFTVYGNAGYEITKGEANERVFKGILQYDNLGQLKTGVASLYKILQQAKLLRLKLDANDESREFFNTEGFTVTNVMVESNRVTAMLEMTIIEDGIVEDVLGTIFLLLETGDSLLLETGDKLLKES